MSLTKVELTATEIEALARAAFGAGARVTGLRAAQGGIYNAAYHLELAGGGPARTFLKVAPPDHVPVLTYERALLRTEIGVLTALGEACIPAVPAVLAQDLTRRTVDRDCVFLQALDGEPLWAVRENLDEAELIGLRRRIGALSASFATVTAAAFGYPGAPTLQAPTWGEAFRLIVAALLDDARRFDGPLPIPLDELATRFDAAMPDFADITAAGLVHYDLWDGNILVARDAEGWAVTGLIDWERAFYGDPLAEIVSLCLFGGAAQHTATLEAFSQAGGPSSDSDEARRRLALYRAYLWLIMLVEAKPRGQGGSILLPGSEAARLLIKDLEKARRP